MKSGGGGVLFHGDHHMFPRSSFWPPDFLAVKIREIRGVKKMCDYGTCGLKRQNNSQYQKRVFLLPQFFSFVLRHFAPVDGAVLETPKTFQSVYKDKSRKIR